MNLPIGFFDLLLLAVLVTGVCSGRRHGMSGELLDLLKWLAVLCGSATLYRGLGEELSRTGLFGRLSGYLVAYLASGLGIILLFVLLKRALGGKLLGSDIFGRGEYYLGMVSGMVRHACVLLAVLALLNARCFTAVEVRRMQDFQNAEFGSDLFPTLHSVQASVFEKSLLGPWIRNHLDFLLIERTEPDRREYHLREFKVPS